MKRKTIESFYFLLQYANKDKWFIYFFYFFFGYETIDNHSARATFMVRFFNYKPRLLGSWTHLKTVETLPKQEIRNSKPHKKMALGKCNLTLSF